MKQLLKKTTQKFGFTIARTISSYNNPFAEFGIERESFETRDDGYFFKELNIFLKEDQLNSILLTGYSYARNIVQIANGKFLFVEDELFLQLGNLRFQLDEFEELYILNEIFVEGCYNINTQENDCVLIDIGMNVGFSSLYFSQREEFKKIYSYEPFEETYLLAKRNLNLNPAYQQKIQANNFGLSKADGLLKVAYSNEARGRMGVNGVPSDMVTATKEDRTLELKDAKHVLEPIFAANSDKCFVLKCDCEGAEYEIIERMNEAGLLKKISYCMVEWHYKSPETLVMCLKANGFTTITTTFEHHNAGIIYGFKR
ncbi:MAG: FkbM family methyltransferase [Chitinophagaceae bacterium]|nr:MAG: FkbM family methyltransferase [Chitinophagaceae bacterium]